MLAQDSYEYIKIGLAIRYLRHFVSTGTAGSALEAERDLRTHLGKANFSVSLAACNASCYAELVNELEAKNRTDAVDALAAKMSEEFERIEATVFAEASTKRIYSLPARRFNTEFLLTTPEKLLKEGAFEKLNEIAKIDFASACRCILFGEATAAAFHILRATESVLKVYYCHHRRQNRLQKPMWAGMVDQLRAKTRNRPPAALLASLDLIRTAYRNPTNHPEAIYQIDSAQDLFGVCLDVIGKMTDEL